MKTSVPRPLRALAATVLVLATANPTGLHAADGTIHFIGAIVAAPYEIHRATATAAPPLATRRGARGEVVFERQWVDRPSASMQVQAVGMQALDLAYTDSLGRPRAFDANGVLALGRDGGRLSLARPSSRPAGAPAPGALLTVSYD